MFSLPLVHKFKLIKGPFKSYDKGGRTQIIPIFSKKGFLQIYPKEFIKRIFKRADLLHVLGDS
jgi:hypothetical protein